MKTSKILYSLLSIFILLITPQAGALPYVKGNLIGQLGNQMFVIAAATSLALDHGAYATFPDLIKPRPHLDKNIPHNYQMIFSQLNTLISKKTPKFSYNEPFFHYQPIPYHRNMEISGYFQSEKYFKKHKRQVINIFSPSEAIKKYLYDKYGDIIDHPNAVAIHYRSYLKEDPNQDTYPKLDISYYEKAISLFPEDSLFVVFTNDMAFCKSEFAALPQQMRYIENEDYIYDFYLMSLCKHNIICNSTFSWWAAYINRNPNKVVVTPQTWFTKKSGLNGKDLLPSEWVKINN